MTNEVFLASRNAKKLAELRRILAEVIPDVVVLGLDDVAPYPEPVEDQETFAANSLLKARAAHAETGLPSLADDSGLCVAALNGMPGVLSARWSGLPKSDERNNALLLDQMLDVPVARRGAAFECALAFCYTDELGATHELTVSGQMRGTITDRPVGEGGFGYDVIFVPSDQEGTLTSAQLSPGQKDAISHRGKALREIAPIAAAALQQM